VRIDRATTVKSVVQLLVALVVVSVATAHDRELSDEAMESFLRNAEVLRIEQMLPGSTYPMALELSSGEGVRRAAYKYRPGDLSETRDSSDEGDGSPAADSYLYEVAAYRIDRQLGLEMVPVAVIRDIHAEGAVIEWISDALPKQEFQAGGNPLEVSESLVEQEASMRLFDALILNEDRKPSDQLVTPANGKLHLLDHSRAFRPSSELPESFLEQPVSLSRRLLDRLIQLNSESLAELLEGLLTEGQIEAMLERRDKILEKVSSDRQRYGEAQVFRE
jgi:hypothetical protein